MIVTTTHGVEGKTVQCYLGIVSAESILGTNFFKDLVAGFRDTFGGRVSGYEKEFAEAKA